MSYSATTAQPFLIAGAIGASPRLWMYASADDSTTVDGSGYFTDGYTLGMRDGDLCLVYYSTSKKWYGHTVTVSGTTVDLADGTVIGLNTNSD
jgi:hypothetical protein